MVFVKIERKWLVLVASSCGCASSIGLLPNLTVLYNEWLEEFRRSKAETAVVQSVCNGISNIAGVVIGILVSKFGTRTVGVLSGILSALGFSLAFFCNSVACLVIVFGVPAGLGSGGLYITSATAVGQHFDGKEKSIALSVMSLIGGAGGIFFPYIINILSLKYGWRGCMLVIGAIVMQNIPLFAICKPKNGQNAKLLHGSVTSDNNSAKKDVLSQIKILFTNKQFYIITFALACVFSSIMSTGIIVVDYFQSIGFSRDDAVLMFLIVPIADTVNRLTPGLLKQVRHISVFAITVFHATIGAAALLAFPFVHSFAAHAVLMGCIGFSIAGTLGSVIHMSILKTTGIELFSLGLGIALTFSGICRMIAGPVTGYIHDVTGSYDASFYFNGALGCVGVLFYATLFYLHNLKPRNITWESVKREPADDVV